MIYGEFNSVDDNDLNEHEDLLQKLNITEEQYICAIRASIKITTVFLKRSCQETRINNYNNPILSAWRANLDVQFVIDVYAYTTYVASYVTKSQRGMSELLRIATQEARQGNKGLKE